MPKPERLLGSSGVSNHINTDVHQTLYLAISQDIAAKDAEKARAEVKAAAATKAAAKLRADGVKGEAERERLAAELEGMKAKFEVLDRELP